MSILEFAVAYDLTIINCYFKKREEHLITFKSGSTRTQIDYFLMRMKDRRMCRDCKVILSVCLTMQHRLLVIDVEIRSAIRRRRTIRVYKVKWWNLKEENVTRICKRIKAEGKWRIERDSSRIREEMPECIRRSAREVLGVSREGSGGMKGAWR